MIFCDEKVDPRIIDGTETPPNHYPWLIYITKSYEGKLGKFLLFHYPKPMTSKRSEEESDRRGSKWAIIEKSDYDLIIRNVNGFS